MIRYFSFCIFSISALISLAQQDPLFNKYMFNPLVINPAYAGSREAVSTVALHRQQWVNFGGGAPNTQTISIHGPLWQKKMGLGLSLMRDEIGPTNTTGLLGAYAYRFQLGHGKLSFGLRGAIYQYRFDVNEVEFKNPEDNITSQITSWLPSFDFGIRYHTSKFYSGISFSHLNQPSTDSTKIASVNYSFNLQPYMTFTLGYAFEINPNLVFKPSILYKASTTNIGNNIDLNASFLFNKKLWAGVSVRPNTGVVMVQYDFNHSFSAGYSYDYVFGKLSTTNVGSHEVFVRYDIEFRKSPVLSPRYF